MVQIVIKRKTKMTFFMPVLLVLTLFISSCSTFFQSKSTERSIANEIATPVTLDELVTIKSSPKIHKDKNYIQQIPNLFKSDNVYIEFVLDEKMPSENAFKILPVVENQKPKVKILFSPNAFHDHDAVAELARFYYQMTQSKFMTSFSIFELYYNAKEQDFLSLQVLAKLRQAAVDQKGYRPLNEQDLTGIDERKEYWTNIKDQFAKQERLYNKKIKVQTEARKSVMDTLDTVSEDKQFRNLVAKNDRKGAAALLRSYLPWEHMAPFEKLFWETHLEVMANPLPLDQRVLIYRGIDGDIIQTGEEAGKKLSKTEAIKDQKIFLLSTMMSKNQGTWNRRLRSLNSMYDKFMGADNGGSSEFTKSARISHMFLRHSEKPQGSPFLSYTPSFKIARSFGMQTNTAYFVDPRVMYFNFASKFAAEIEFLLPLASFPDDLAAVYDYQVQTGVDPDEVEAFLKKTAIERIEREMGAGTGEKIFERITKNSADFFSPSLAGKIVNANPIAAIQKVHAQEDFITTLTDMFKDDPEKLDSILKPTLLQYQAVQEAEDAEQTAKEIAAMDANKSTCKSLIQLFWK